MNIIGRLTRNAEVRTLSNEKPIVNFSIATNENDRNKQGERIEQSTYFDCFYRISPNAAEPLNTRALADLNGRAYTSAWTGKTVRYTRYSISLNHRLNCTAVVKGQ